MTIEIISYSISTKVWDQTRIEHATPGSVRHESVARHITDCAMRPGVVVVMLFLLLLLVVMVHGAGGMWVRYVVVVVVCSGGGM